MQLNGLITDQCEAVPSQSHTVIVQINQDVACMRNGPLSRRHGYGATQGAIWKSAGGAARRFNQILCGRTLNWVQSASVFIFLFPCTCVKLCGLFHYCSVCLSVCFEFFYYCSVCLSFRLGGSCFWPACLSICLSIRLILTHFWFVCLSVFCLFHFCLSVCSSVLDDLTLGLLFYLILASVCRSVRGSGWCPQRYTGHYVQRSP